MALVDATAPTVLMTTMRAMAQAIGLMASAETVAEAAGTAAAALTAAAVTALLTVVPERAALAASPLPLQPRPSSACAHANGQRRLHGKRDAAPPRLRYAHDSPL